MTQDATKYHINRFAKEESWRMFKIMGEFVTGFEALSNIEPSITIYGSSKVEQNDPVSLQASEIAFKLAKRGFTVVTGGGPGVMEAANKGAMEGGGLSVGLSIDLANEQASNKYTNLSLRFHYFFVRKVMLVKYASAFILMPGGWGTLDELFETLNLIQTQKIRPFPTILVGRDYWKGLMDWMKSNTLTKGYILNKDLDLIQMADSTDEVMEIIEKSVVKNDTLPSP
ncbi:MAG: TIGR00730 family Rossman fold protein [Dehalococcoidia bacterium]|nr:TIGR00730 family Rossman fold protein [Dehalococcoidia bacterium]